MFCDGTYLKYIGDSVRIYRVWPKITAIILFKICSLSKEIQNFKSIRQIIAMFQKLCINKIEIQSMERPLSFFKKNCIFFRKKFIQFEVRIQFLIFPYVYD